MYLFCKMYKITVICTTTLHVPMYALATLSYTNLSIIWEQIFLSLYILAKLKILRFYRAYKSQIVCKRLKIHVTIEQ